GDDRAELDRAAVRAAARPSARVDRPGRHRSTIAIRVRTRRLSQAPALAVQARARGGTGVHVAEHAAIERRLALLLVLPKHPRPGRAAAVPAPSETRSAGGRSSARA